MFFQSRMVQMGETIAMIAHQWRQPLNNIAIMNQSLYVKYKKNRIDDEAFEKFFKNSKEQIELMSRTIDDFRGFFKPDKEKKIFCINDNLVKLLNLTKPEFDRCNIFIQRDCHEKLYIEGYPNEFSQAVLNILNNAKEALLTNQILDKKIVISLKKDEDQNIVLRILDNAKGIDEKIIDKIFDPYFSTKKGKNGTGLGLYMSKLIIEDHMNGKLKAYNDKDMDGAVLEIRFAQNVKGGGSFRSYLSLF